MTIQELEEVIAREGKNIYSFCLHITGRKQLADELYQDTFLKATEKINTLQADGNIKSYLLSVALMLWKNQKRKYAWRNRIAPEEVLDEQVQETADEAEDVLHDCLKQEQCKMVRKAVSALPDKYRMCVLLYYMEEMSVAQVAEILKIPKGTVMSRLSAARKRMETELEGYYYE